ncbi:uncharacterized protein EI90DRAFT_3144088 [Cantharellus anzutake]|uniref:uncharacterized protein n=1 Tax=Cantharellus anzutake TaxID=1750568 RepID=UPI001907F1E1|nr:uncharacterized protein EI90DRAFT_3144088 [Cantharellus anzutake]KAF8339816.1 hypothetical protein EI90DRAFT_3144088 [Cantharellus anzutake]
MTDARDYRTNADNGSLTALLVVPAVAGSMLLLAIRMQRNQTPLASSQWLVEPPINTGIEPGPLRSLVHSRHYLVQLSTFCSFLMLLHILLSSFWHAICARVLYRPTIPSEGKRTVYFFTCAITITIAILGLRYLTHLDLTFISLCYQFTLYLLIRLARGGFTLGEVGVVAQASTALFTETINLTLYHHGPVKIWPRQYPIIRTFRLPGPLLIFQLALVPGALLSGALLSPLLVLSRINAQKPSRRLRFPHQRELQRRILAFGFYIGVGAIVIGPVGGWTRWCLSGRDPWLWVIFWLREGKGKWSRPALVAFWVLSILLLVQGKKSRLLHSKEPSLGVGDDGSGIAPQSRAAGLRISFLGLNGRRKFFHALAVVMFIPGIVLDPAFTHLAFSVAFSSFIFAEYVRYFALYPFGASVHLFLSEFLDEKDSGSAILSHFYLLTGCAGPLWLEGSSRLLNCTGVFILGVGDALASIAGKRWGKHRWSENSPKTIEGTIAFWLGALGFPLALSTLGIVERFSGWRYTIAALMSACLEAFSMQNDNLLLPIYSWSLLVAIDVG